MSTHPLVLAARIDSELELARLAYVAGEYMKADSYVAAAQRWTEQLRETL